MILEVPSDLSGLAIERHDGRGVEIVAGALVAHPGAAVAGAPIGEIGLRIVGRGHPDRSASGLPLIASRPGLAAGLTRFSTIKVRQSSLPVSGS